VIIRPDTQLCISIAQKPGRFGIRFHNYLYEHLKLPFIYKSFAVTDLTGAVQAIRSLGIRGCAVTMPFKEKILPLLDQLSTPARAIGSVNTVVQNKGTLWGTNTVYIAMMETLAKHHIPRQASVLVRGNGGMARAILYALRQKKYTDVCLWTRRASAGRRLAMRFGVQCTTRSTSSADVLINATPIGSAALPKQSAFSAAQIQKARWVIDAVISTTHTPLIQAARHLRRSTADGFQLAVIQGREQFHLYTGVRPSERLIQAAARFARQPDRR